MFETVKISKKFHQDVVSTAGTMIQQQIFEDTFKDGMLIQVSRNVSEISIKSKIYNTMVDNYFVVIGSKM